MNNRQWAFQKQARSLCVPRGRIWPGNPKLEKIGLANTALPVLGAASGNIVILSEAKNLVGPGSGRFFASLRMTASHACRMATFRTYARKNRKYWHPQSYVS